MVRSRRQEKKAIDPHFLLVAYRNGYFPMADSKEGEIAWYSPERRGIIDLESFSVPRSLRRVLRQESFQVRINAAFEQTIRACADREETWISEEIVECYLELHRQGYAHSVEAWKDGLLAGGLYGVALGGAFFGESMFSKEPDASKVALAVLVGRLRERGFVLLDTQFVTEHLSRYGAIEISRMDYLLQLQKALVLDVLFV
ncbi:MAG: leucyl/phenylalanyl-tRNA--protein transferase [Ignavibacteria bacterium]|nr:leucyl/phenylalanyl-tRNA--protein transferase [Ignavibacteria bacterium]